MGVRDRRSGRPQLANSDNRNSRNNRTLTAGKGRTGKVKGGGGGGRDEKQSGKSSKAGNQVKSGPSPAKSPNRGVKNTSKEKCDGRDTSEGDSGRPSARQKHNLRKEPKESAKRRSAGTAESQQSV